MSEKLDITKQCIKCLESFPLNNENFRINVKTRDGFKNECKKCDSIRAQEYYLKHKKKLIKNILKKRAENKKLEKQQKQGLKKASKQNTVVSSPI